MSILVYKELVMADFRGEQTWSEIRSQYLLPLAKDHLILAGMFDITPSSFCTNTA